MDWFGNLPTSILENILCLLPIQEAVRTCILSREWRYRWIKIPKLVFIQDALQVSTDGAEFSIFEQTLKFDAQRFKDESIMIFKRRKFFYAINQVLSMHEGPIHEFTLSGEVDPRCDEIAHIISQVEQRNTVKKLRLLFDWVAYCPPASGFSLCQLTDLCLEGGCVMLDLSNCRSLKSLTLGNSGRYELKSANEDSSIINLFECLPVVETLSIPLDNHYYITQSFYPSVHDRIPRELPTALIHLKYLTINYVRFSDKDGLSILFLLIKSSPNLEKLKIDDGGLDVYYVFREAGLLPEHDICSFTLKDYADIWLEHLSELEIGSFKNQGNELNFVKLILAKSPALKKVMIYLDHEEVADDEELQICKALLSTPRASPVVCTIV